MKKFLFCDKAFDDELKLVSAEDEIQARLKVIEYLFKNDSEVWSIMKERLEIELTDINDLPSL